MRRGLAASVDGTRVEIDLLDPSAFSIAEARSVLGPPFDVRAEHEVRLQDLAPATGGFDVAWATHALYAIPPGEIGAGIDRMVRALRVGGFGAVVHATSSSHYMRFAEAFRATFAPGATPFTVAEEVLDALVGAGASASIDSLHYTVGSDDRAVLEGFLQRCAFDDTVDLARMEAEGPCAEYLAGCRTEDGGYRFAQDVLVITWEAGA